MKKIIMLLLLLSPVALFSGVEIVEKSKGFWSKPDNRLQLAVGLGTGTFNMNDSANNNQLGGVTIGLDAFTEIRATQGLSLLLELMENLPTYVPQDSKGNEYSLPGSVTIAIFAKANLPHSQSLYPWVAAGIEEDLPSVGYADPQDTNKTLWTRDENWVPGAELGVEWRLTQPKEHAFFAGEGSLNFSIHMPLVKSIGHAGSDGKEQMDATSTNFNISYGYHFMSWF